MSESNRGVDLAALETAFGKAEGLRDAELDRFVEELRRDQPELAAELAGMLAARDAPDDRLSADGDAQGEVWDELGSGAGEVLPEGTPIGDFRLHEKIGQGGMATVYRATRKTEDFRQEVAVKVLHSASASTAMRARFNRERRIVAALDHPNIARLIDGGVTESGHLYFALELVHGEPIDRYADREKLTVEERVRLVADVGRALHYAHSNLVIHRDLKPSNVFVDGFGRARLLDFGIAKEIDAEESLSMLTRSGRMPMTPRYASPEQLSGDPITTASDQYQLGLLLFELLTGTCHHLMDGTDASSILRRVGELASPRPSRVLETHTGIEPRPDLERVAARRGTGPRELVQAVKGDLDWIVLRALAKRPERRYPSTAALVEDLERYLAGEAVQARSPSPLYVARKWIGRHKAVASLGAVVLLMTVGFFGLTRYQGRRATEVQAFAQRIELETEQMERVLRDAALQPLHDTTRERTFVRERIARIDEEASARPKLLGPAGDYGVGRGLLALGEFEEAAERLRSSWAGGFRGDGLRWALGIALGELYRTELTKARAVSNPELREQRLEQARSEYRDEALEQLRGLEPVLEERAEEPAALIALYEGRLEDALGRIARVREAFPWARWALALEAEVLNQRSQERFLAGDHEGARADLRQSEAVLAEALEMGRSDSELFLRECQRLNVVLQIDSAGPRADIRGLLEAAEVACFKASTIRPEWEEPFLTLSSIYLAAWDAGRRWQIDDEVLVTRMRNVAERARELAPDRTESHHRVGLAEYFDGQRLYLRSLDPSVHFEAGLRSLERAIELDDTYPFNYNGIALISNNLANWRMRHGLDPTDLLERGRAAADRAVELIPKWHNARSNLARSHNLRGHWQSLAGRGDPVAEFEAALDASRKILDANPRYITGLSIRAQSYYSLGSITQLAGGDPTEHASSATTLADQGLERVPDDGVFHLFGGAARLLEAWHRQEIDPQRLAEARDRLGRAQEGFGGESSHVAALEVAVEILAATRAPAAVSSAAHSRLRAQLERLGRRETIDAYVGWVLGYGYRVLAIDRLARGLDAGGELENGMRWVDRAISENPLHWPARLERAALYIVGELGSMAGEPLLLARTELRQVAETQPRAAVWVEPLVAAADMIEAGGSVGELRQALRADVMPYPFRH